eukprot:TRINITY_DN10644_c1_g1_i1.p1 TRINITY_DN10644_c1_g1~~TRINITY_DN10644_c1_g1_i1.p1  ORF type:complete len:292 (-),score=24.70 TRINITY_DN10644_c1_g1_i1:174-1049(-)
MPRTVAKKQPSQQWRIDSVSNLIEAPWRSRRAKGDGPEEGVSATVDASALAPDDQTDGEAPTLLDSKRLKLTSLSEGSDSVCCEGEAALTVCDSGRRIIGYGIAHITGAASNHAKLGFAMTVIADRVDCQQEMEWGLLHVRIQNYDSGQEVSLIAEKTGGDALRITPPADEGIVQSLGLHLPSSVPSFHFNCKVIKDGPAAMQHVSVFHRDQADKWDDFVVNTGHITISNLPPMFGGEVPDVLQHDVSAPMPACEAGRMRAPLQRTLGTRGNCQSRSLLFCQLSTIASIVF